MALRSIEEVKATLKAEARQRFVGQYVAQFLAAFAAVTYVDNCQRGWPSRDQPVEDAECLAEEAWEQLQKLHA